MPLLTKKDIKIFYIHIPRTAGRVLTQWFSDNNFKVDYYDWDSPFRINGNDIAIGHLGYPDYNLLPGVRECFKFTTVRHPLHRFISMCRIAPYDFNKVKTKKDFNEAVAFYKLKTKGMNWFIPQCNFVDKETPYWKIEDKFEKSFFKWLGITLEKEIGDWRKWLEENKTNNPYDFKPAPVLSPIVKNLVKDYYKKDYERFNYD